MDWGELGERLDETNDNLTLITRASRAGFFSDFFWALEGIKWAHENNVGYVVHFGADDCRGPKACSEMSGWSWSDFFLCETQELSVPDCSTLSRIGATSHPSGANASSLDDLRITFHSHSGLNSRTRQVVDDHVAFSEEVNALGVHFRSGDMRWAPSHPTPPSRKLMIRLIAEELAADPSYSTLFVATEDKGFVRMARKVFSGVIQVTTSPELGKSGEFASRCAKELGVLIDCNNLARCATVIHSSSNVAAASAVLGGGRPPLRKEVRLGSNHKRLPISVFKGLMLFEFLARVREKRVEVKEYRSE